MKLKKKIESH